MCDILDDCMVNMMPYYVHYFNLVHQIEEQAINEANGNERAGLSSATLFSLKKKLMDELVLREEAIERQIVNIKYRVELEQFRYSIMFYSDGTTPWLEEKGYEPQPVAERVKAMSDCLIEQFFRVFP